MTPGGVNVLKNIATKRTLIRNNYLALPVATTVCAFMRGASGGISGPPREPETTHFVWAPLRVSFLIDAFLIDVTGGGCISIPVPEASCVGAAPYNAGTSSGQDLQDVLARSFFIPRTTPTPARKHNCTSH
jgi:hypothetical protein